jgi:predicted RNase H-like nuclease (RuvC/YqgF family)
MSHDQDYLEKRVRELEAKVLQLRLSRRVLMLLLERQEQQTATFRERLERENRRLMRANYQYAQSLLQKNRQIHELESRLQTGGAGKSGH